MEKYNYDWRVYMVIFVGFAIFHKIKGGKEVATNVRKEVATNVKYKH